MMPPSMEKPNGLLNMIFLMSFMGGAAMAQKVQFDVGLILDSGSLVGKMSNTSISTALEDFYESHPDYTTQVVFHGRDSDMDVVGAASAGMFSCMLHPRHVLRLTKRNGGIRLVCKKAP
ncbi:Glutamate receptor 1.2 [Acorus calamus]|uniref:Glutamate receptor 1.2 n=1 Tax=Acorus calamus TaxID=4465 RepID=A0AAV9CVE6_ACOCL|nr:Glutamate receptor 1.2 [Acorus calamus]